MNEPIIVLSPEFIILSISSLVYIVTISILLLRKNKTGLVKSYIAMVSICLYLSIGEILVILFCHYNIPYVNLVFSAKYIPSFFLGPVWLIFSMYYTRHRFIKDGFNIKIAAIVFLPNLPFMIIGEFNFNGIFSYMVDGLVHYTYVFWIYMSLQLFYNILGNVFMLRYAKVSSPTIRKCTAVIMISDMLSFLITYFYYAFNIQHRMGNMDILPVALVVFVLFQGIASLKYRFLNIFPMALQGIVQNMNEGVIIVDSECKIIFANQTASGIFDGFDVQECVDALELSSYIENNGNFGSDGKTVVRAIGKGGVQSLSGEVKLYNRLQLQLNYRPLINNKELIGWIVSFIDVGEYKTLLDELNEKNNRLSDAYSTLSQHANVVEELAAARERDKMASEIHDSLGHSLAVLVALLEVSKLSLPNDIETVREKTEQAYGLAKSSLKELRMTVSNMSHNVYVSSEAERSSQTHAKFDVYSLLNSLESLKEGFEATGIKVELTVKGNPEANLTAKTVETLYCICREALTNALKHGEATVVNIILRFGEEFVELFIFDNGKGSEEIVKGMGLSGMENRVLGLGGKISFGSGGEKGFNIHVEIPFK